MSKQDNNRNKPGGKPVSGTNKNKLVVAISASAVVVIAVLCGVIFTLLNTKPAPPVMYEKDYGAKGMVITPENLDEMLETLGGPVEDSYFEVNMNTNWVFDTWDTKSTSAFVKNKESNLRTVYIDVVLAGTNQLVYSSPYIPVGSTLKDFSLDAQLPAGVYDAVVTYRLVDDDFNEITDLSVTVKLVISH